MVNVIKNRDLLPGIRWIIFYIGLFLSPLTPGNDAIVNQLPSAFLAALLAHQATGTTYDALYVTFYVTSNILGVLLMLVNFPELQRRWRRILQLRREDQTKFWSVIAWDVFTFIIFFAAGKLVISGIN
jgi:hypothetical protein